GITAGFNLKGLAFSVKDLTVDYDQPNSEVDVFGSLTVSAGSVLNNVTATLGDGDGSAGIKVKNGKLEQLDVTLNGSFNLFGISVSPEQLRVDYDSNLDRLQITGGMVAQVSPQIRGEVSLPAADANGDGGVVINTSTGAVTVNKVHFSFDVS